MELLKQLNIKPHDLSIYETAFAHTSYANEKKVKSYERLEFLGDAVLELLMSKYLYNINKFHLKSLLQLFSNRIYFLLFELISLWQLPAIHYWNQLYYSIYLP